MKAKKKISSGANNENKPVGKKGTAKKAVKKKQTTKSEKAEERVVLSETDVKQTKKKAKKKASRGVKKTADETLISLPEKEVATAGEIQEKEAQVKTEFDIEKIPIPPILFEGDTPAPVEPLWMKQKYALGPETVKNHFTTEEESFELPESYGTGEMTVAARDPYWIYAAWDLTLKQIRSYNRLSSKGHMILRIYIDKPEGAPEKEIHLYPHSRDWFINVDQPGLTYVIVLGYYDKQGKFVDVIVSEPVKTPKPITERVFTEFVSDKAKADARQAVSPERPSEATTKESLSISEKTSKEEPQLPLSPSERVSKREMGLPSPDESAKLAAMATPLVQAGSQEISRLEGAGKPAQPAPHISREIHPAPSSIEFGISSPSARAQPQEKKFWFNIQAEIIIYGATEPDAIVQIAGEKIKLRPDGTFTLRFALPDGFYKLPASAVSADGKDMRLVMLEFSRKTTPVQGETGECPSNLPTIPDSRK